MKNKKIKTALGTMALSFLMLSTNQIVQAESIDKKEESVNVIVVFNNKQSFEKEKLELLKSKSSYIKDEYNNINGLSLNLTKEEAKELENNPNVKIIEEDIKFHIKADYKDWGIDKVKASESWIDGYTGKGVKIAVADTGVDTDHSDLKIKGGASFVDYTTSYEDDNGHGTHVTGIIGAQKNNYGIVGTSPDADIYALKVLNAEGEGFNSAIIAAIDWAITNDIDIINLSLGSEAGSPALKAIIDKAYANDTLVVAAAGNEGTEAGNTDTMNYPAFYDKAIAVAAVDENNIRANFSSTGKSVDFAAPGVGIASTYLNNKYVYLDGTSMAAPYVTGVLALYKEANPKLTNNELNSLLEKNAIDLGEKGKDSWYGFGLVQAPYKQTMKAKITTTQTNYKIGQKVYLNTFVTDAENKPVVLANVVIKITQPNGNVLTYKGSTNASGNANIILMTPSYLPLGKYNTTVSVSKSDFRLGTANTMFNLNLN